MISTGSKALQDQLFSRDLPTSSRALKFTGCVALLKGRSNYFRLERLEQQSLAEGDFPVQALSDVMHLRGWVSETVDGDISTCGTVAEDSTVWPIVTSTNDNCLGQDSQAVSGPLRAEGVYKGNGCRRGGEPSPVSGRYGG